MSGGMEDASAVGGISRRLQEATHKLLEAIEEAEAGHRGIGVDVRGTVNEILVPAGWNLQRWAAR
jgi:hypothetical protein